MANTDFTEIELGPLEKAQAWLEDGDEPICVKIVAKNGDPLDLSANEVKKVIIMLQTLVDKVSANE